jgi:hypothetical protein
MNRFTLASLLSILPLAACVDEAEPADTEENLGTTESELCTDGTADAVVAFKDKQGFSGASSAGPSSSYDRAACADHYSVEVTGVGAATQPFFVTAGWGEPLLNDAQSCPLALATVQTQEYRQTGFNCSGMFCIPKYGWVNVGNEITMHGVWTPGNFGGCNLALEPGQQLPTFQPSFFRSKVRVSVRAFAWAVFFPAYKKAMGGVYSPPAPPA